MPTLDPRKQFFDAIREHGLEDDLWLSITHKKVMERIEKKTGHPQPHISEMLTTERIQQLMEISLNEIAEVMMSRMEVRN
jgi:hypothetical protein